MYKLKQDVDVRKLLDFGYKRHEYLFWGEEYVKFIFTQRTHYKITINVKTKNVFVEKFVKKKDGLYHIDIEMTAYHLKDIIKAGLIEFEDGVDNE